MYIDITPLEVERFEKERNCSFFSLLKSPTFSNAVTLVSLVRRCDEDLALKWLMGYLKESSLFDFFSELRDEFIELGYCSETSSDTSEDIDEDITFSKVWREAEVEVRSTGLSKEDYWGSSPSFVIKMIEKHNKDELAKAQNEISQMLNNAKLLALAVNAPSKLPKKAPSIEGLTPVPSDSQEQTSDDQIAVLRRNKQRVMKATSKPTEVRESEEYLL